MAKTKNVVYLNHWQLFFKKVDGKENRSTIVDTFADYYVANRMDTYEVPGNCIMGGRIYGHGGFPDGTMMFTASIETIERVNISMAKGVRDDLLCATTELGEKYYFFADEPSPLMGLLFKDSLHGGLLNDEDGYYVETQMHKRHPEFL